MGVICEEHAELIPENENWILGESHREGNEITWISSINPSVSLDLGDKNHTKGV